MDQILPHPGNPVLDEPCTRDARDYVELAEKAHGPIPRPVDFAYVWGDALNELQGVQTDVRIINLETSITASEDFCPEKEVLYRMHPDNVHCLTAAGIDCCCLANNHALDWGHHGLADTILTLNWASVAHAGAGSNAADAGCPATLPVRGNHRVLVFAFGSMDSGIPWGWAATEERPGISLLDNLSEGTARRLASRMRVFRRLGDAVIVSVHWGGNWGYEISDQQVKFAHQLVDEGIDVVHGHSSHHVKAVEVYRDRLILYGCGDFLTDYEGIGAYEVFRKDLSVMYLAKLNAGEGRLVELRLVPMQSRRFRLNRVSEVDAKWLCDR